MSATMDDLKRHSTSTDVGCMVWTRGKTSVGYGAVNSSGRQHGVHRLAYELVHGPIPNGMCVLHKCDVRSCFNPDHLFLGSKTDNNRDRDAKLRQARGERNGNSVLTAELVREIRGGVLSVRKAAKIFGVDRTTIHRVRQRKIWSHV